MRLETARYDELAETFTSSEIADIKAAIDIPRANVNIVPYHIYSPNEQVVGEWQEMVDGVLKKKPVYEKTLTGLSISMNWLQQYYVYGTIEPISYIDTIQSFRILNGSFFEPCSVDIESNTWRIICLSNVNFTATEAVIEYTKSSDSWEVVE